jgi:hypothetical protein
MYPELYASWHALNPLTVTVDDVPEMVYCVVVLGSVHLLVDVLRPTLPSNHSTRGAVGNVGVHPGYAELVNVGEAPKLVIS